NQGIALQRFTLRDPLLGFIAAGGTVMAAIAAELEYGQAAGASDAPRRILGLDGERLPERTAAAVLQILGLGRREAEDIACRPLPAVAGHSDAN
ncbi:hypothetical protein, partial [Paludibacterium sp.]|uniref:hypothetical protein n=1 Tax=Paludibacterium sp. TaxID=1917523 RepID=UPI0025E81289